MQNGSRIGWRIGFTNVWNSSSGLQRRRSDQHGPDLDRLHLALREGASPLARRRLQVDHEIVVRSGPGAGVDGRHLAPRRRLRAIAFRIVALETVYV